MPAIDNRGANSGSREPNPQAVSALSGFDPGRVDDLIAGCDHIAARLERVTSFLPCETFGELERYHDLLAAAVVDIAAQLRSTLVAIKEQSA